MPLNLSRSLLTIILPGVVATAPWLLLLLVSIPELQPWYEIHAFPMHVAAFAIAVTAGALFEGIGSYVECVWDHAKGKEEVPMAPDGDWVQRDWHAYLSRAFGDDEPVAYRYISRKVTALYFEFGMMMAIPCGLIGLGVLAQILVSDRVLAPWIFMTLAILAAFIFRKFAADTHDVLCETRYFLNRIGK